MIRPSPNIETKPKSTGNKQSEKTNNDQSEGKMNPDLDTVCPLCFGIIPKHSYNTHLYNHHLITTDVGIRHQQSLLQSCQDASQQSINISSQSSNSEIKFNLSKQGYDTNVRQLLDDKNFNEALRVLNAR